MMIVTMSRPCSDCATVAPPCSCPAILCSSRRKRYGCPKRAPLCHGADSRESTIPCPACRGSGHGARGGIAFVPRFITVVGLHGGNCARLDPSPHPHQTAAGCRYALPRDLQCMHPEG